MNIVINGLDTVLFLVIDHHGDREHGREDARFVHGGLLPCIRSLWRGDSLSVGYSGHGHCHDHASRDYDLGALCILHAVR